MERSEDRRGEAREASEARELAPTRSLEMSVAHPLSAPRIDAAVARAAPGSYALGYMDGDAFVVFYVGRSDSDVRQRLHEWVGRPSQPGRLLRYGSRAKASWGAYPRPRGGLPVNAPALGRVESGESPYTHFAYRYADSAETAYAQEWQSYDRFGGESLDNEREPSP